MTSLHTVSAAEYETAVGNAPVDDDLERVNCPEAGQIGHIYCGWCTACGKPPLREFPEVCTRCGGTGLVTISYGGDGYGDKCCAMADADDQPCPECTP